MKNLIRIGLVIILFSLLCFTLQAQESYAKIDKNRNVRAEGLYHDLNKTKDTLILKSDKKISYLYSINKNDGREFDFYVDTTSYKLPLNKLSVGKHVFVAVQSPMRIVFVVHVLKDIPKDLPENKVSKDIVAIEPVKVASIEND